MPASHSRYAFTSFTDLDVGQYFVFDADYAGKRWPDTYTKTGSRTFRDVPSVYRNAPLAQEDMRDAHA
jgi:hypothetical protein